MSYASPPRSEVCPVPVRKDTDGHSWKFDGDDPYVVCAGCDEVRDAITDVVIRSGRMSYARAACDVARDVACVVTFRLPDGELVHVYGTAGAVVQHGAQGDAYSRWIEVDWGAGPVRQLEVPPGARAADVATILDVIAAGP
jgi:hypothetical protein